MKFKVIINLIQEEYEVEADCEEDVIDIAYQFANDKMDIVVEEVEEDE